MTHHTQGCDAFQAGLSSYLELELDDSTLADAELHLASCATCRALVADLRAVTRQAAALPALAPGRDLWTDIEARIAPQVLPLVARTAARPRWHLGAVAAGLVAVTALSTWQLARRTPPATSPTVSVTTPAPAAASNVAEPREAPSRVAPVSTSPTRARPEARVTYGEEITRLRGMLVERSNELDPATVAILESSIATIDSAIVEAKAALDRDPASGFLASQLNKSLEHKLRLLRKAALLSAST